MGLSAIHRIIESERPQGVAGRAFTPSSPQEIEPHLGIIPMQHSFLKSHMMHHVWDESLYHNGPPLEDFYLNRAVRGETGTIKRQPAVADCSFTRYGLAMSVDVRSGLFGNKIQHQSVGLLDKIDHLSRTSNERKALLARGIFCVLNPADSEPLVELMEVIHLELQAKRIAKNKLVSVLNQISQSSQ